MDYETELVVVIKTKAFNITEDEALDHVLGYAGAHFICFCVLEVRVLNGTTAGHDVSHRGWQIDRGGQVHIWFNSVSG